MRTLFITLAALVGSLSSLSFYHSSDIEDANNAAADFLQVFLESEAKYLTPAGLAAKYRAWNLLCFELRDVNCGSNVPPQVKTFRPNPFRPGLMGYYDGTGLIYIRDNLMGNRRVEVLAHEMSHYLDTQLGLNPSLPVYADDPVAILSLCFSEKRAWSVSDNFNSTYVTRSKVVGETWINWYKHCTPHKDALYPKSD